TYVDDKGYVQYRRRAQEDAWIVPYNPMLLLKLECHINFEIASTVHLFMYLYKYLFKGPDHINYTINNKFENSSQQPINEFNDYINGRYLSAPEAAWRIFRYPVTTSDPSVLTLPIHLQNANIPQYRRTRNITSTASLLDRYFLRPLDSRFKQLHNNLNATEITLQQIASMIAERGRRMKDFGLPEPNTWTREIIG
ncbi:4677_t:CDS:2, partial [Racocetra fulgida]